MSAAVALDDPQLERVFRRQLQVNMNRLPGRLRVSEVDAAELVSRWIDLGLVVVWPEAPDGPALVLTVQARADLKVWEDDPPAQWRRDDEVPFTDLEPGEASMVRALVDPTTRTAQQRGELDGWFMPAVGLGAVWGVAEVSRHKIGRQPRKASNGSASPCPVCDGVEIRRGGCCLVCERLSNSAEAVLERHESRPEAPVKPAPRFQPRGRGARRKKWNAASQ